MNWTGKIIGLIVGSLFLGFPFGSLIGLAIGHFFDQGGFRRFSSRSTSGQRSPVQKIFFDSTFIIMGFVAKSDGRVSEREIAAAQRVMAQMNLSPEMKQEAIRQFNLGKQPNFNPEHTLKKLRAACWMHPSLLRTFLEIQVQMAHADGQLSAPNRAALQSICQVLGIRGFNFDQFERQYRAGQNYQQYYQQAQANPRAHLQDAYAILDVPASASDADIKKAYRRLMSKHHPDKLIAKGVPQEMVKLATQKTQQIKKAYETIKKARGLS